MGIQQFGQLRQMIDAVASADDLMLAMIEISAMLGFEYFALTHHVDVFRSTSRFIRLHNYPERWVSYYDAQGFGVSDPVHRASHVTSAGFCWSNMPRMIPLTVADRKVLALGRENGVGDGFTVPANVPGEACGSCSFANSFSRAMPEAMFPIAQLAGIFAFESARRLWSIRRTDEEREGSVLTDRQRDCVLWAARGKGDWEISRILGLSEETVARHIRQACERYGVHKRTSLAIRALFDGTLTFSDIFRR